MNTKSRLILGSALSAVAAGNLLPALSAAFGAITWAEVREGAAMLNLFLIMPAALAAAAAGWIYSGDPDLRAGSSRLHAFGVTLLGFVAYFLIMLVWAPIVRNLPGVERGPHLPETASLMLFQTLIVAMLAFAVVWAFEAIAIRWATASHTGA